MARKAASTPIAEIEIEAPTTETTFSAKELATEAGTDPKSFRRWLRTYTNDRANKGGRWVFTPEVKGEVLAAYAARGAKGTTPTPKAEAAEVTDEG